MGKTSGHWELAGVPVSFGWDTFPRTRPCFPPELITALCTRAKLPGVLGNCHASGTEIIAELGAEHMRSGKPICYTSADSVFQIAAHEQAFGLERLYAVCATARPLLDAYAVCRAIARPFIGDAVTGFVRTANRKDYAVPPPRRQSWHTQLRKGETSSASEREPTFLLIRVQGAFSKGRQ